MFGGGSNSPAHKIESDHKEESNPSPSPSPDPSVPTNINASGQTASGEKRGGNGSPTGRDDLIGANEKKRRSSGVSSKASSLLASARNSLGFAQSGRGGTDLSTQSPLHKFGKQDSALAVPQGPRNNSAGESVPGPKSTFRVGVWEDRNKRCRRTMEDTHAFLYNFLETPAPSNDAQEKQAPARNAAIVGRQDKDKQETVQSDNGYFAIFDGHAGTFAADWCGKKVHLILEDIIRKNPSAPVPELLDQTFTTVDAQLEKLPLKNSGCTAAIAVLRWEDRVSSERSVTGSVPIAPAVADAEKDGQATDGGASGVPTTSEEHARLKSRARRQRVLYTANVGDARIILCRGGKALRLSYDHKGSDENEGRRIANAGGLIVNNRVNGVLAVTRALGDVYIKELVTGHPYTTETVIQADLDEFLIIACDGLWDVCSDQEAVDLVRPVSDPDAASKLLVDHALGRFSTDNLSCMIIRFCKGATTQGDGGRDSTSSVDGATAKVSEADQIVLSTRLQLAEEDAADSERPAPSKGSGHDKSASLAQSEEGSSVPTLADGKVEEAPATLAQLDGRERKPGSTTCEATRGGGPEAARAQPGTE